MRVENIIQPPTLPNSTLITSSNWNTNDTSP